MAGRGGYEYITEREKKLQTFQTLLDASACWQTKHGHQAEDKADTVSGLFSRRDCELQRV